MLLPVQQYTKTPLLKAADKLQSYSRVSEAVETTSHAGLLTCHRSVADKSATVDSNTITLHRSVGSDDSLQERKIAVACSYKSIENRVDFLKWKCPMTPKSWSKINFRRRGGDAYSNTVTPIFWTNWAYFSSYNLFYAAGCIVFWILNETNQTTIISYLYIILMYNNSLVITWNEPQGSYKEAHTKQFALPLWGEAE